MRLREYLEIQSRFKSKLKEDYDDDDDYEDYVELEDAIDFDLESVGFIRNEYEDDSYYRLTAYSVEGADRVLVSACAPDDDTNIYNIYATISGDLSAEDTTKLPHSTVVANPRVSTIPADQMTPNDWKAFHDDCVAYQKEYEKAESEKQSNIKLAEDYDDDYDYSEGDSAWQEAADELANYKIIQIDDELKSGNFVKYLASKGIKDTDIVTVDNFVDMLLTYLKDNVEANPNIGYAFCTGDHLYLYRNGDVMHLNMGEDYSLDYFPDFEFNSDVVRDIYYELPGKPSYRTHQKATLKDTVANLISIVSETYGAVIDLL